jgi:excinuclease ABC subunit B
MTVPQLGAMYEGDKARKQTLIEFGFRLPSALDNRPLKFVEFEKKVGQVIYTSATPGKYEIQKAQKTRNKRQEKKYVIEQLVRPTGLLDPKIDVRPTQNQIPDLIKEIKKRVVKKQRVLVTTLTKRIAEDLAEYLSEEGVKTHYLHSEIKTLERPEILKKLRQGDYDVVVGINLLREGLDLPEVSLVAILDADKEGFLRNDTTLIQTIGRVSRHLEGQAVMYADHITLSMKRAIEETNRRRKYQEIYNKKHKTKPQSIIKKIRADIVEIKAPAKPTQTSKEYFKEYLRELQFKMDLANRNLQFDEAMRLKEEIEKLKKIAKK